MRCSPPESKYILREAKGVGDKEGSSAKGSSLIPEGACKTSDEGKQCREICTSSRRAPPIPSETRTDPRTNVAGSTQVECRTDSQTVGLTGKDTESQAPVESSAIELIRKAAVNRMKARIFRKRDVTRGNVPPNCRPHSSSPAINGNTPASNEEGNASKTKPGSKMATKSRIPRPITRLAKDKGGTVPETRNAEKCVTAPNPCQPSKVKLKQKTKFEQREENIRVATTHENIDMHDGSKATEHVKQVKCASVVPAKPRVKFSLITKGKVCGTENAKRQRAMTLNPATEAFNKDAARVLGKGTTPLDLPCTGSTRVKECEKEEQPQKKKTHPVKQKSGFIARGRSPSRGSGRVVKRTPKGKTLPAKSKSPTQVMRNLTKAQGLCAAPEFSCLSVTRDVRTVSVTKHRQVFFSALPAVRTRQKVKYLSPQTANSLTAVRTARGLSAGQQGGKQLQGGSSSLNKLYSGIGQNVAEHHDPTDKTCLVKALPRKLISGSLALIQNRASEKILLEQERGLEALMRRVQWVQRRSAAQLRMVRSLGRVLTKARPQPPRKVVSDEYGGPGIRAVSTSLIWLDDGEEPRHTS